MWDQAIQDTCPSKFIRLATKGWAKGHKGNSMEADEERAEREKRSTQLQRALAAKQAVEVLQRTISFQPSEKALEEQLQGIHRECEQGQVYLAGAPTKGWGAAASKNTGKGAWKGKQFPNGRRPTDLRGTCAEALSICMVR